MMWMLLLLAGCLAPKGTGPTSMIGRLIDADGAPLAGVWVETVESRWNTAADGTFAVNYKEPSQFLTFSKGAVTYTRRYREEDRGTNVQIQAPPTHALRFLCELADPCETEVTWELGDGLTAAAMIPCERGEPVVLTAAPEGAPSSAVCHTDGLDAPVHAIVHDDEIWLTPPPVDVTVDLSVERGQHPASCLVTIGGVPAMKTGAGLWTASAFGMVQLESVCDGIPGPPTRWYVRTPVQVPLVWRPSALTLDLRTVAPWASEAYLYAAGEDGGWTLQLSPGPDGLLHLPALTPGPYVLGLGVLASRLPGTILLDTAEKDVLHLTETPREARVTDAPEAIGVLNRTLTTRAGAIPVKLYPAEE